MLFYLENEYDIQTIIYNQIIKDKEDELSKFNKFINDKKRNKLSDLRSRSDKIKVNFFEEKSKFTPDSNSKISEETQFKNISLSVDSCVYRELIEKAKRD